MMILTGEEGSQQQDHDSNANRRIADIEYQKWTEIAEVEVEEVDDMAGAYAQPGCAYFVVERDGRVCGGGGIAPLDDPEPGICELRKMYFLPELRGLGAGKALIGQCLDTARKLGYRRCYLETLTGMDAAQKLYEARGFARIPKALGNTGHFGCNRFYIRELEV